MSPRTAHPAKASKRPRVKRYVRMLAEDHETARLAVFQMWALAEQTMPLSSDQTASLREAGEKAIMALALPMDGPAQQRLRGSMQRAMIDRVLYDGTKPEPAAILKVLATRPELAHLKPTVRFIQKYLRKLEYPPAG